MAELEASELARSLREAIEARSGALALDPSHRGALRLYNGFLEGDRELALDLFARTLVVHDHGPRPADVEHVRRVVAEVRGQLPWIRAAVWKARHAESAEARNGLVVLGAPADVDDRIVEDGVRYAVRLTLHQDASFYLDTRELRRWLRRTQVDKHVLNTFAYTGSLGVAAAVAPAARVVQVDRNRSFLEVGMRSYALNGLPARRRDFVVGDFFEVVSRMKRAGELFDCVVVDPPFFSKTHAGRVDLEGGARRVLDKIRPLVGDGGALVVVNNALFLPGAELMGVIDELCEDGYVALEERIGVPPEHTRGATRSSWPADPAPFEHSTKIAVLRVRRKDGRRAPG